MLNQVQHDIFFDFLRDHQNLKSGIWNLESEINTNQKYLKFPLTLPLSPRGRGRGEGVI
jgi:hypothetical protein